MMRTKFNLFRDRSIRSDLKFNIYTVLIKKTGNQYRNIPIQRENAAKTTGHRGGAGSRGLWGD